MVKRPMKVLHVIPSLSPALGGPTEVALQIVSAIRKQGVQGEIVTTNYAPQEPMAVPLGKRVEYQGVPVWFLPASTASLGEFIFSGALTKWLWQHIGNYDLLDNHYLFSYAPSCAGAIARLRKIPYTVRTQGQLTPWALSQSSNIKWLYSTLLERRNLSRAMAIHCTTAEEAHDLENFGIATPTITLPLGVDLPILIPQAKAKLRQLYQLPESSQILLFLSRLHPKKRPDLLLASFREVLKTQADCYLFMVGSGEPGYVEFLQKLALEYGVNDRLIWPGFITGDTKKLLLQGADIFALPSHSENFGIAVAEAMAAGLPVVVTPGVQIASDIALAQGGIVINSQGELTSALLQLLNCPILRSQLGQNGRQFARHKYNWQHIATQLISRYQEIIDGQSEPETPFKKVSSHNFT